MGVYHPVLLTGRPEFRGGDAPDQRGVVRSVRPEKAIGGELSPLVLIIVCEQTVDPGVHRVTEAGEARLRGVYGAVYVRAAPPSKHALDEV